MQFNLKNSTGVEPQQTIAKVSQEQETRIKKVTYYIYHKNAAYVIHWEFWRVRDNGQFTVDRQRSRWHKSETMVSAYVTVTGMKCVTETISGTLPFHENIFCRPRLFRPGQSWAWAWSQCCSHWKGMRNLLGSLTPHLRPNNLHAEAAPP